MANTSYQAFATRPHWAGTNADLSIHIEAYEGDIEGSFRVESMFRSSGLTNFKSVANRTNIWRGDRIGAVQVKGRRAGEKLDEQRIVSDKFNITVDTVTYVRTDVDFQDDWTAPDFQAEYSAEHASAHAKAFDQAHLIQLIKAGAWVAPADLKASGAFNDGISKTLTGYSALIVPTATQENLEEAANILVRQHKDVIATFVNRDMGGSVESFVTLVRPETFNILVEHKKLMNVQFQGNQGDNNFVARRVAWMNGLRVIETPRFPQGAITNHHLGSAFNVTADEAKACMVLFDPRKTLVTVEAKAMTVDYWTDKKEFTNVLDSYHMYQIGIKRGDAVAVFFVD